MTQGEARRQDENLLEVADRQDCEAMKDEVVISLATRADVPAIHALLEGLAASTGKAGAIAATAEDLERHAFGERPEFKAVIAWRSGEPVGLALFFPEFSTWRGRPGIYVQDLYVAPQMRDEGLGRRLLGAVIACNAERGATYLRLSTDVENTAASRFYRRIGFREDTENRVLVLEGPAFRALPAPAD
jgi:ribosomal protein S18 acetylase RimI-like enzyme